jgi:hypothetical protein
MIFCIKLELFKGKEWPIIEFCKTNEITKISETTINEFQKQVCFKIDVNETITLLNVNKSDYDTIVENNVIIRDQKVSIVKIWAEDILLDDNVCLNNINFIPKYHSGYLKYCQDNNIEVSETVKTNQLYFNGKWVFNFSKPFWDWYQNERLKLGKNYNNDFINADSYLNLNIKHNELINELKNKINEL